ncbi:MAG TPA: DUF262 domain-containing protein [Lacunisphaera sp.]|jgi:hypothetical protein
MNRRASTEDISWFLDLDRNGQLELNPPYQRRSVWTAKDRRFFLDTIFRGYPCPAVFLNKTIHSETHQTRYDVVDGKQRLQTILMFSRDQIAIAADFNDERFNGKKMSQLGTDEKNVFWNYILPVEFLTFAANDTHAVNLAFERMNRNSRKLEPQELRHARWDGWFMRRVESECSDAVWKNIGIVTVSRAKRMKDAQFLSELLLVAIEKRQHGFDQNFIDDSYGKYDEVGEEDSDLEFDEEAFDSEIARLKSLMTSIDAAGGALKKAASTLQSFYTIWAALALNRFNASNPAVVGAKLATFLTTLDEIRAAEDRLTLISAQPDQYRRAYEFFEGLQGASTDLVLREKRINALVAYMAS